MDQLEALASNVDAIVVVAFDYEGYVLWSAHGADNMLVVIHPPVIGQRYGLGASDITRLLLTGRHVGYSLYPSRRLPCHVYVSRILNETIIETGSLTTGDVEMMTWGVIFKTLEEAEAYARR